MIRPLVASLLTLCFLVCVGCSGAPALPAPRPLPHVDPPGEDGLSAPAGVDMLSGEQPGIGGTLSIASLLQPAAARAHVDAAQSLLGFDGLSDGTLFAWSDGPLPRASIRYALAAKDDSLLGALAQTPQAPRLPAWIAHPAVEGYLYCNDLLGTIDGLDRFLAGDQLTSQIRISGALGGTGGISTLMRDLYEIGFEEDFANWWDGEFLLVWLRHEAALKPVWIFGVHDPRVANDKARQMLAMYYFYLHTDRGIFQSEQVASGATLQRLIEYGGADAHLDLAYALDDTRLMLGSAEGLTLLLSGEPIAEVPDPATHLVWDAGLLQHDPHSLALGFDGSAEAVETMSKFLERAIGLIPGGGREASRRLGEMFGDPGLQRIVVDIVPGRFQWWLMGERARDPQSVSTVWNTALIGATFAIANMKGWDQPDVIATTGSTDAETPKRVVPNRPFRKPFWRKR